jgi:hypothetical protein
LAQPADTEPGLLMVSMPAVAAVVFAVPVVPKTLYFMWVSPSDVASVDC